MGIKVGKRNIGDLGLGLGLEVGTGMRVGYRDWGLGIRDWGLGIGDWGLEIGNRIG